MPDSYCSRMIQGKLRGKLVVEVASWLVTFILYQQESFSAELYFVTSFSSLSIFVVSHPSSPGNSTELIELPAYGQRQKNIAAKLEVLENKG